MAISYPSAGGGFFSVNSSTSQQPLVNQKQIDANLDVINENAKRKLLNDYNQQIQGTVNNLNSRGMFGSSIANEDVGRVNYNQGQALSNLEGLTAQNKISSLKDSSTLDLQLKQLQMQQDQFNQQQKMQQDQQEYARKLAEQQRLDNLKSLYGRSYWLYD